MTQAGDEATKRPLDMLGGLAMQEAWLAPGLRHAEIFTLQGLLTLLWHGDPASDRLVLMCGGAMGGLLGPANGLYHDLAVAFAEEGIATMRVGYRKPGDLERCTLDVSAAADLAWRSGARRFVTMGHSFGGAIAVRVGASIPAVAGVVTLATQSAGCEVAGRLEGRPLILFHGDRDELLPLGVSQTVLAVAGSGELVELPGTGHLMLEAADELRSRLVEWVPAVLGAQGSAR